MLHLRKQPPNDGQPSQEIHLNVALLLGPVESSLEQLRQVGAEFIGCGTAPTVIAEVEVAYVGLGVMEDLLEQELLSLLSPPGAEKDIMAEVVHPHFEPREGQGR
jgi:hypothetical protein